jgi:carbamoyl-phosphate synthase large subunit
LEHIEEAGVHSGDSACAIPPPTLSGDVVTVIANHTRALADALGVVGVINVQYAVKDGTVYILEANPRASRTVPFVSKATAVPLAKVAARLMVGATLAELRAEGLIPANAGADGGGHVAVKEAALPFDRFGVDTLLGPEMRSTGEVMGIDRTFGVAFAKSQTAVGNKLPDRGSVFLSLADRDKPAGLTAARRFADLGFTLVATAGTAAACEAEGIPIGAVVAKLGPGERGDPDAPGVRGVSEVVVGVDAVDLIASGKVNLVVNTPRGRGPRADGAHIRLAASAHGVPCLTTIAAALAAAAGIAESRTEEPRVRSLQEYHRDAQLRLPL